MEEVVYLSLHFSHREHQDHLPKQATIKVFQSDANEFMEQLASKGYPAFYVLKAFNGEILYMETSVVVLARITPAELVREVEEAAGPQTLAEAAALR